MASYGKGSRARRNACYIFGKHGEEQQRHHVYSQIKNKNIRRRKVRVLLIHNCREEKMRNNSWSFASQGNGQEDDVVKTLFCQHLLKSWDISLIK